MVKVYCFTIAYTCTRVHNNIQVDHLTYMVDE